MVRRWLPLGLGMLLAVLLAAVPLGYSAHRQANLRNFRVVQEGVLYRSGQLSRAGLERVLHDYGIRTVITLRDADREGDPPPDLAEEQYCRAQGVDYHRIRPRRWWSADDGPAPAEKGVKEFLRIMDDPGHYPVLVHCFAGIHRTGAHCAIFRMEYHHWTNTEALAELKALGYRNLDNEEDVLGYLEQYRPRWQREPR